MKLRRTAGVPHAAAAWAWPTVAAAEAVRRTTAARLLRVVVTDRGGRPVPSGGLAGWLARVAPTRARGVVGVALLSDARVRALNRQYRSRDYATDVLSFPTSDAGRPFRGRRCPAGPKDRRDIRTPDSQSLGSSPYLGDIVIARGVARRQARMAGHDERQELRVLALHGLLHLLGYDHEHDNGQMVRIERALRKKGGLPEGLTERGAREALRGKK